MTTSAESLESVASFRGRAREWIGRNLTPVSDEEGTDTGEGDDDARWMRARHLQARLYEGGFAGICYPREYGGLGLTPAHQWAFNEEVAGYEMPTLLNVPTFAICGPTILDMGTEEQKRERLTAMIRGDEVFAQFLSEPTSGSDLAGATTRATRDGDVFILN